MIDRLAARSERAWARQGYNNYDYAGAAVVAAPRTTPAATLPTQPSAMSDSLYNRHPSSRVISSGAPMPRTSTESQACPSPPASAPSFSLSLNETTQYAQRIVGMLKNTLSGILPTYAQTGANASPAMLSTQSTPRHATANDASSSSSYYSGTSSGAVLDREYALNECDGRAATMTRSATTLPTSVDSPRGESEPAVHRPAYREPTAAERSSLSPRQTHTYRTHSSHAPPAAARRAHVVFADDEAAGQLSLPPRASREDNNDYATRALAESSIRRPPPAARSQRGGVTSSNQRQAVHPSSSVSNYSSSSLSSYRPAGDVSASSRSAPERSAAPVASHITVNNYYTFSPMMPNDYVSFLPSTPSALAYRPVVSGLHAQSGVKRVRGRDSEVRVLAMSGVRGEGAIHANPSDGEDGGTRSNNTNNHNQNGEERRGADAAAHAQTDPARRPDSPKTVTLRPPVEARREETGKLQLGKGAVPSVSSAPAPAANPFSFGSAMSSTNTASSATANKPAEAKPAAAPAKPAAPLFGSSAASAAVTNGFVKPGPPAVIAEDDGFAPGADSDDDDDDARRNGSSAKRGRTDSAQPAFTFGGAVNGAVKPAFGQTNAFGSSAPAPAANPFSFGSAMSSTNTASSATANKPADAKPAAAPAKPAAPLFGSSAASAAVTNGFVKPGPPAVIAEDDGFAPGADSDDDDDDARRNGSSAKRGRTDSAQPAFTFGGAVNGAVKPAFGQTNAFGSSAPAPAANPFSFGSAMSSTNTASSATANKPAEAKPAAAPAKPAAPLFGSSAVSAAVTNGFVKPGPPAVIAEDDGFAPGADSDDDDDDARRNGSSAKRGRTDSAQPAFTFGGAVNGAVKPAFGQTNAFGSSAPAPAANPFSFGSAMSSTNTASSATANKPAEAKPAVAPVFSPFGSAPPSSGNPFSSGASGSTVFGKRF